MPTRKTGLQATVCKFASGGPEYIGDLINGTLTVDVADEDASGVADEFGFAWATGRDWTFEGEFFAATTAWGMPLNGTVVALTFNTGGNTYTGNALVTHTEHGVEKRSLQKHRMTLKGQGAITIA